MYPVIDAQNPDLVVFDIVLGDTDGISAVRELRRRGSNARTLILTSQTNRVFVHDAFRAGADGYALKGQPLAEVIEAIRTAGTGTRYLSPQLPMPEESTRNGNGEAGLGIEKLSPREREVFCRIIQGHSSREIARSLCISLKTVETHRLHINRKLGVHSPGEAIRLAAVAGMITA
jgi:DNA-binding NarL/FixJ family response regulator